MGTRAVPPRNYVESLEQRVLATEQVLRTLSCSRDDNLAELLDIEDDDERVRRLQEAATTVKDSKALAEKELYASVEQIFTPPAAAPPRQVGPRKSRSTFSEWLTRFTGAFLRQSLYAYSRSKCGRRILLRAIHSVISIALRISHCLSNRLSATLRLCLHPGPDLPSLPRAS